MYVTKFDGWSATWVTMPTQRIAKRCVGIVTYVADQLSNFVPYIYIIQNNFNNNYLLYEGYWPIESKID